MSIREFLNTADERHAFTIGWAETMLPCRPRFRDVSTTIQNQIRDEYHYYQLGRIFGLSCWIATLYGIIFTIL